MTDHPDAKCPLAGPILEAIRARGYTAGQIGRAAQLNERGIRRWMKGEKDITVRSLGQIAQALGFHAAEIKRPAKPPGRPKGQARPTITPLADLADGAPEKNSEIPAID